VPPRARRGAHRRSARPSGAASRRRRRARPRARARRRRRGRAARRGAAAPRRGARGSRRRRGPSSRRRPPRPRPRPRRGARPRGRRGRATCAGGGGGSRPGARPPGGGPPGGGRRPAPGGGGGGGGRRAALPERPARRGPLPRGGARGGHERRAPGVVGGAGVGAGVEQRPRDGTAALEHSPVERRAAAAVAGADAPPGREERLDVLDAPVRAGPVQRRRPAARGVDDGPVAPRREQAGRLHRKVQFGSCYLDSIAPAGLHASTKQDAYGILPLPGGLACGAARARPKPLIPVSMLPSAPLARQQPFNFRTAGEPNTHNSSFCILQDAYGILPLPGGLACGAARARPSGALARAEPLIPVSMLPSAPLARQQPFNFRTAGEPNAHNSSFYIRMDGKSQLKLMIP